MTVTAHRTLGSEFQVDISSTLTAIPGFTEFEFDPGENTDFEKGDIASDFDEVQGTGVQSGGTTTGTIIWDPLNTVQQFLHARFNDGATVDGNVVMGSTAVEYTVAFYVKKWKVKGDRKAGFVIDFEFKHTDRVTLNESSPA